MKRPRILLVTTEHDITTDYVVLALEERKVPFLRLNTDVFPLDAHAIFRCESMSSPSWEWIHGEVDSHLDDIRAIYYRRHRLPVFPEELDSGTREFCARETSWFLRGALLTRKAEWMNHPTNTTVAEAKLAQLDSATRLGFRIPSTLATNDPQAARTFFEKHRGQIVAKPVRSGYINHVKSQSSIFTSRVDESALSDLDSLSLAPVIFQEHLAKKYDLRVTVVATTVFATAIHSQTDPAARTDWRATERPDLPHTRYELQKEMADRCIQLTQALGLTFGAIDFILTPQGDHVFLEINPAGQWAWLQDSTGDPIAETIAMWLQETAD